MDRCEYEQEEREKNTRMRSLRNNRELEVGWGVGADEEPASYRCLNVPTHPHQNDKKDARFSTLSEYENRREKGGGRGGGE
jgi:hypothetical protein